MMGQTVRFRQAFAISCYAFLTGLVSSALAIATMFLTDPDDFDLRNPVALNLGFFLDPHSSPKWLISLGTSLDLLSFWTMALLATGFSVAGRNLSWPKAFAGVSRGAARQHKREHRNWKRQPPSHQISAQGTITASRWNSAR